MLPPRHSSDSPALRSVALPTRLAIVFPFRRADFTLARLAMCQREHLRAESSKRASATLGNASGRVVGSHNLPACFDREGLGTVDSWRNQALDSTHFCPRNESAPT